MSRFGAFSVEKGDLYSSLVSPEFTVIVFHLGNEVDAHNDNVDIEVVLRDGRRYVATAATIDSIQALMASYRETGECAQGLYFWAADLIIVRVLTNTAIFECVKNLIATEEIASAMSLATES